MTVLGLCSSTHICALIGRAVLLPLPLLFLLLQLLDALLEHVGPEVAFEIWQLLGARQPVFCCLLEDILNVQRKKQLVFRFIKHTFQKVNQWGK